MGIEADEFIADLIISSPYDYLDGVSKFCATRIRKIEACIDNNSAVLQAEADESGAVNIQFKLVVSCGY